jgi:hypothetical protein
VDRGEGAILNSDLTENSTFGVPTKQFAARNLVKPASVIKRRCTTGTYFGIHAVELANGRLSWPDVVVTKGRG